MTTPAIPLATNAPTLAPTLAVTLPGAAEAFAALFAPDGDAAGPGTADRQDDASGGKTLPADSESADGITAVVPPAMLAWLLTPVPVAAEAASAPMATAAALCGTAPAMEGFAPSTSTDLTGAPMSPGREAPTVQSVPPLLVPSKAVSAEMDAPVTGEAQPQAVASALADSSVVALRSRHAAAPRLAPLATTTPPLPALAAAEAAPAARVFAAAIHQLVAPGERAEPESGGTPLTSLTALDTTPIAVDAPAAAGDAQLNMADRRWPEAMIARISALRDASDALAATASIAKDHATVRLSPDALGTVEVRLHREDDQVRVQLTAEQPRTQALLADAQPRLTELAEARGIRVVHAGASQSGNDAGTPSQGRGQPPAAPSTIRNLTADEGADASSDGRIA